MQTLVAQQTLADPSTQPPKVSERKRLKNCGILGNALGILLGFSGLVYGLIASGRLII
ncbi:hypothetical protein [Paraglaciecola sp. 2405UD69-4]|uniref:hypothetical protein n=1 Tax=Paraglaciecola sp. 2405UD69-4 TaxID=3391836 RepID=UPI0039C8F4A4